MVQIGVLLRDRSTTFARPESRYTATAQALHWLTALLMLAILPVAWHMTMLGKDESTRDAWFTLHRSLGLTILALSILRILWRAMHPPPDLPHAMARIEALAARGSHWLLYVILFAMPVSGYILSAAGGHPVSYFGLFEIPPIVPVAKDLARFGGAVHIVGQWAVYALIALHLLGTVWHVTVQRDGVLDRMLPRQDEAE